MKNNVKNKRTKRSYIASLFVLVVALVSVLFLGVDSIYAHIEPQSQGPYFSHRTRSNPANLASNTFQVTGSPAITVLTHGLGGDAAHWSNNANREFSFDNRSLIERLRQQSGGNVFRAKMSYDGTRFTLGRVPIVGQGQPYNLTPVTNLASSTINNHIIIVFEASPNGGSGNHQRKYSEFRTMLHSIVRDFSFLTNGIYPRINLVGHSRGGLTNMEFANNYPRLIDSMFAIGTPFNGSNFGRVNLFSTLVVDDYNDPALLDINNVSMQNRLRDNWNTNRVNGRGRHINFFTLSGYSTLGMIADVAGGVWGTIASTMLAQLPLTSKIVVTVASDIIWRTEWALGLTQTSSGVISDAFYSALSGWSFLWLGRSTLVHDDLLVHRDSQEAQGFNEVNRNFRKRFTTGIFGTNHNFDQNRTSIPHFAIVHNLQTRDDDFINHIMSNIRLGRSQITPLSFSFTPSTFGFRNQYYFSERTTTHWIDNQFGINIRRLRTAYNPDEDFIVLSSNREGVSPIHGAFFEVSSINRPIRRLEVELGLWSNIEFVNSQGVEIYLWYMDAFGNWWRHTNLQSLALPTRAQARTFTFNFADNTLGFKIQVRVNNPQGTQNRGRLVIGNMTIHTPLTWDIHSLVKEDM